ncbi:MAG TPA: VWA domain-containing protein [Geobacteraceae bacterium]|nr:VWA domain-containing protein [Geobacteraceae bacterium]
MSIQYPWALLLLALVPAVLIARRRHALRTGFSWVPAIGEELQPGLLKAYGADLLAGAAMVLIVMAAANVQYSSYWQKTYPETKWIMLVQDLSGSMGRPADVSGSKTLGDVALEGTRAFIDMRKKDDLIGIIAFSNIAQLVAPPSFDREILKKKLELLSRKNDSTVFRDLTVGGETNASYAAWLAVCVFFMFLPEENQPTYEQIDNLRYSLMGPSDAVMNIPGKLKDIDFGRGMAIVLFTDGRIEASKASADKERGLLNFVNVIGLIKQLGIKLYIVVVGGDVTSDVRQALEGPTGESSSGHIFYMPRTFDGKQITAVYNRINEMEKNRLLVKLEKRKKDTRGPLALAAAVVLSAYGLFRTLPSTRRI